MILVMGKAKRDSQNGQKKKWEEMQKKSIAKSELKMKRYCEVKKK